MKSVLDYVRNLLGWRDEIPITRTSFKRDRNVDDFSSDDESPANKRLRNMKKSVLPDVLVTKDRENENRPPSVCYVPVQVESELPTTSTPIETVPRLSRVRTVPRTLVDEIDCSRATPPQNTRVPTPVRPMANKVVDNDDDEVKYVESKPEIKKRPQIIIDLDDKNDEDKNSCQDEDVIFVKRVSLQSICDNYDDTTEDPVYYKLKRINDRNTQHISPKTNSKFRTPAGISKTYKKAPTPLPRWLQPERQTQANSILSNARNKYVGNIRSTLSQVFNLDEKKNYQELIRQASARIKQTPKRKPIDIINLVEDAASFRKTQADQKKSLREINLLERDFSSQKENIDLKEYDPITVASINSSDSEVEIVTSESSTSSSVRIVSVNSLKDSYKDKPITSSDWLANIDSKYKKKKQETEEKLKDARLESNIISKVNIEQKLALLEHKLKHELSIPESLFLEPQPIVEFPPLTADQEDIVNHALGKGPSGEVLATKFNYKIHRHDLLTLSGLNWLNDEIINFYMNLIVQRSEERKDLPKVYATNTFFYPRMVQDGHAAVRRWTRKVDIFSFDLVVVPVHLGVHWCVALVHMRARRVQYLDSMLGDNRRALPALMRYLRDEHRDKKGRALDEAGWVAETLKDIPQQMNGSDCGMFACTFAEFASRNAPYTFTQAHMPYLRRKAVVEIISGKLLL